MKNWITQHLFLRDVLLLAVLILRSPIPMDSPLFELEEAAGELHVL